MIDPKHCPYCRAPASRACAHLALAAEARDFVRRCVELSQAQRQWRAVCEAVRRQKRQSGQWSPERDDFQWLETAFCDEFVKNLTWFGGTDYEWRTGPRPEQGGFWVLLWSKDPQRLWWDLRDEFERRIETAQVGGGHAPPAAAPTGQRIGGSLPPRRQPPGARQTGTRR